MKTISADIAELQPEDEPESFLSRVDHAMYLAKRNSRNQMVTARPEIIN